MSSSNIKTFVKGGIHPQDMKISADRPIENLSVPQAVAVPVSQHIGKPAIPVVKPQDAVKVGTLIAKADGFISANIHSPVSGTIERIDQRLDVTGYKKTCITVKTQGDQWEESIDRSPDIQRDITLSASDIIKKVQEAGIVGLGGATFPSHVKLNPPKDKKVEYVLINGAECEPYLTSDHRLMIEKTEKILIGTRIIMRTLDVQKAYVGIEDNKQDAIERMQTFSKQYEGIEVRTLKTLYPQGGERQIIKAFTGREVPPPPAGLPHDVGCAVFNVATTNAIYEAVQKNKPLIERVVSVTGKSVNNPANLLVRFGTPLEDLINHCGGFPSDTGKVLCGGPMMGRSLSTLNIPFTKGMSGIVFIPKDEAGRKEILNCIRCAKCVSVCPLGLEPYMLMAYTEKGMIDKAWKRKIASCCECGCCSYICPSNRPLLDYLKLGKSIVNAKIREKKKTRG